MFVANWMLTASCFSLLHKFLVKTATYSNFNKKKRYLDASLFSFQNSKLMVKTRNYRACDELISCNAGTTKIIKKSTKNCFEIMIILILIVFAIKCVSYIYTEYFFYTQYPLSGLKYWCFTSNRRSLYWIER